MGRQTRGPFGLFSMRVDPLVLFVILGGLLAWVHAATREDPPTLQREREIVVTEADVAWIVQVFQKTWQRPPTAEERQRLVARRIRNEILFREARALGLDQGDESLRRRLAMKLEFLAKDAASAEPTDAELKAWYEADKEHYATPAARTFVHVFFSEDERGDAARADAEALLAELTKTPERDVTQLGDRTLLEQEHHGLAPRDVTALFGAAFGDALFEQPAKRWVGPLRSSYGWHLVYVRQDVPGQVPPLEAVRERVRGDLLDERREKAFEAYVEALRSQYDVRIEVEGLQEVAR